MWERCIRLIFPLACLGCGEFGVALCPGCAPAPWEAERFRVGDVEAIATGSYDGVLRDAIVRLKHGERGYLRSFAPVLARAIVPGTHLVPLPTSRRRRAARGFDQAVHLARAAAALAGADVHDVLRKRGPAQAGLGRSDRLAAHGRFAVRPRVALPPAAIVIDDVCTTGATLREGIAVLRAAGVRIDGALVLAHASPGRNQHRARAVLSEV